jgi:IclR family KDG regulon transcriptional repressor
MSSYYNAWEDKGGRINGSRQTIGGLVARKIGARNQSKQGGSGDTSSAADRLLLQALVKGLAVFGLFDSLRPEWTVDEITEEVGLPRMTVYRVVKTLESEGYVVGDPATNRYHLGPAILAATYVSSQRWGELARLARPYVEDLASRTRETVTLAVEVDGVAVEIDSVHTPRPFRRQLAPGRVVGYEASAHGKVFLAYMAEQDRERVLAAPFHPPTSQAAADLEALSLTLDRIREDGVAYDFEERDLGTCAVAAPIRDQLGKVVASLGVLAPPGRFGPEQQQFHAEAVKAAAKSFSAVLGYRAREEAG